MRNQDSRGNRWAYFDGRLDSKTDSNAGGQQWATGDEGGHTPGNIRLLCTSTLNHGHTERNLIFLKEVSCHAPMPSLPSTPPPSRLLAARRARIAEALRHVRACFLPWRLIRAFIHLLAEQQAAVNFG